MPNASWRRRGVASARGGGSPTLETKRSGSGKGGAKRRAAQAKRGSLGTPLAGARGGAPSVLKLPLQNRPETWFTAKPDGHGCSVFGHARRCCMPWKESRILDQRLQFLSSYQKEEMSVADLCRAYGISRPTAYRWINRYNETGPEGLIDRSRRPHTCSHATLEPIENAIFVLRAKHPSWGARKLKARLEMLQPDVVWPAASTFGTD